MNEKMPHHFTDSVWQKTSDTPQYPRLQNDISTDICIIGGGIAGVTIAYLLSKTGRQVTLLEGQQIGIGETAHTTAHLSHVLDARYFDLEKLHGLENTKLIAESHSAAIDFIEEIIQKEKIDCDFQRIDGYLFTPNQDEGLLKKEMEAAHQAGLKEVKLLHSLPQSKLSTGPVLRFPNQAQFHPLKYLYALAEKAAEYVDIYQQAQVETIDHEHGKYFLTTASDWKILANTIIVATNSPINTKFTIHTKQAAYRSYVIGCEIPRGTFPKMLLWDTEDPYHYIRLYPDYNSKHDLLIIGGEDHKTGQEQNTEIHFKNLEKWAKQFFPQLGKTVFHWSGQVMESIDRIAYIGATPGDHPNSYLVTGDSGLGMTHGTIAGMIIADLIAGRDNPWVDLYSPARKNLRAGGAFLKEGINVAQQYCQILPGEDISECENMPADSGILVKKGLKTLAAYKDQTGEVHLKSAVCPHLGCLVNWNKTEKSWDCPCHGSRFDPLGKVINGPAHTDLPPADPSDDQ